HGRAGHGSSGESIADRRHFGPPATLLKLAAGGRHGRTRKNTDRVVCGQQPAGIWELATPSNTWHRPGETSHPTPAGPPRVRAATRTRSVKRDACWQQGPPRKNTEKHG